MKPTRQLIVTTLTFIFVLTLNVYAQERKTKKVIKKEKTEIIKKNKKTEQVRPAKGERPTDVKKFSSLTLKSGSKGTPAKPKQESLNQVNGVGTKKAVVQFQKKKKLDSGKTHRSHLKNLRVLAMADGHLDIGEEPLLLAIAHRLLPDSDAAKWFYRCRTHQLPEPGDPFLEPGNQAPANAARRNQKGNKTLHPVRVKTGPF